MKKTGNSRDLVYGAAYLLSEEKVGAYLNMKELNRYPFWCGLKTRENLLPPWHMFTVLAGRRALQPWSIPKRFWTG